MSWEDAKFTVKDIIHYTVVVATAVLMYASLKSGQTENMKTIDRFSEMLKEIQADIKESKKDDNVVNQNLQNQVNTNTQQILLLRQEFELSKKIHTSPNN